MPAGRPPKYETPEEMQRIIDLYFDACKINRLVKFADGDEELLLSGYSDEDKEIISYVESYAPTVSGLAYTLGMSRQALLDYSNKDQFLDTVKRAKQRIEVYLESNLYGQAVTGTIFNLKNNFGWKDKSDHEFTGPNGGPVQTQVTFVGVSKD